MGKPVDGYTEGWAQYQLETEYGIETCDECNVDIRGGETYWTRDDEVMCETCFAEWQEELA